MLLPTLIFLGKIVMGILCATAIYFLLTFLLSWIPKHRKFKNAPEGVEIFIISNGVHTDFVLPTKYLAEAWWKLINIDNFEYSKDQLKYLGFGWGDRGFYLDTPTWAELKFKTAVNAILIPSPTLMHIKGFKTPPADYKYFEKITISDFQFSKLCHYIFNSFYQNENGEIIHLPDKGYTSNDNFYLAKGSYHAFNTCNFWVNKGLRKIGVRTPIWTPIDRGIFYQLGKFSEKKKRA